MSDIQDKLPPKAQNQKEEYRDNQYVFNVTDTGKKTLSAHPSRFSPDDKYSRHRITLKKRFGLYLVHLPQKPF
ncbi:hypothetical protein MERGE_000111 [Pneumocystis wakefieldiae]|uniref:H/ACA ribonucleoprotein complex subunit NOP10 n=1 Tax=Pneumocystis wakefieldiae TaxID=38082 RepID=A0A899FZ37_9ASCO|nr:hypothetical protein MERGE_000111 [Pneumocystis wakefieldiae]